jgi:hypothetical protein
MCGGFKITGCECFNVSIHMLLNFLELFGFISAEFAENEINVIFVMFIFDADTDTGGVVANVGYDAFDAIVSCVGPTDAGTDSAEW